MDEPRYKAFKVKGVEDTLLVIAEDWGHAAEIFKEIIKDLDPMGRILRIDFIDYVANYPQGWTSTKGYEWLAGKDKPNK